MEHNRLTVARRLREPDIARNHRVEDLAGEVTMDLVANLLRHARPAVEHRQHDTLNTESRIEALANELHGPEQVRQTFQCVELALERNEHTVRGHQSINSEQTQLRRTIDQDITVRGGDPGERSSQTMLASLHSYELDFRADEVDV